MVEKAEITIMADGACRASDLTADEWQQAYLAETSRLEAHLTEMAPELEQVRRERDDYKLKWEQACAMGHLQAENQQAWNKLEYRRKQLSAERLAGARVKALEWEEDRDDDGTEIHRTRGGEVNLPYSIYEDGFTKNPFGLSLNQLRIGSFNTVNGAKAAAQADYERRILSALAEPAGEAEPVQVGWAYRDKRWDEDRWHVCGWEKPREHEGREVRPIFVLDTPPDASAIREALANQVRAVTCHLNGQAYSSTVSALNYFDAALSRAALAGAKP